MLGCTRCGTSPFALSFLQDFPYAGGASLCTGRKGKQAGIGDQAASTVRSNEGFCRRGAAIARRLRSARHGRHAHLS
jgi:hypothetical protein